MQKLPTIAVTCHRDDLNAPSLSQAYLYSLTRHSALPLMTYEIPAGGAQWLAENADGLLLTGGCDVDPDRYGAMAHVDTRIDPLRDRAEWALLDAFTQTGKPIMGICRGIQVMNVYFGGTLHQHLPDLEGVDFEHGDKNASHPVEIAPDAFLSGLFGQGTCVNTSHHQAIDAVAPGFRAVAWSKEPARIIEAIEHEKNPSWIAVQWHPERMGERMVPLFARFVGMCRGE